MAVVVVRFITIKDSETLMTRRLIYRGIGRTGATGA